MNIGLHCSRREVFERNGTHGSDILSHGNFLLYLHYFIFGPDLPAATIVSLQKRIHESGGYLSGSDYPELDSIVREAIRNHCLDPKEAAEEFFKLGLECVLDLYLARHFRDTAKRIKRASGRMRGHAPFVRSGFAPTLTPGRSSRESQKYRHPTGPGPRQAAVACAWQGSV